MNVNSAVSDPAVFLLSLVWTRYFIYTAVSYTCKQNLSKTMHILMHRLPRSMVMAICIIISCARLAICIEKKHLVVPGKTEIHSTDCSS